MKTGRPVFYISRMLPDYRVAVLERLNERLGGRLVVCHGPPPQASSLRKLTTAPDYSFRHVPLTNVWLRGDAVHAQPFLAPFRQYGAPSVVLAEESPRSLTLPLLLAYARWRGAGRVLWGHFSSNDRPFRPEAHLLDRYRLWLARRAEACVAYTEPIADLLRPYLPAEHLFVARNTLDTDRLFALYDALDAEGRASVRRRLDLPAEEPVLVFIGRLLASKGTGALLDVFAGLRQERSATLLVIGDGPERATMEHRVDREGLEGVRFLGALTQWEDSAPYLYASDLMLMPGYLGLAVNHAFAFGLPIVSQVAPASGGRYHSPEVAFVEDGENGLLAPHGDPGTLLDAVRAVLADRDRFARSALHTARTRLTLDQMVDGLEAAVRYAAKQGAR